MGGDVKFDSGAPAMKTVLQSACAMWILVGLGPTFAADIPLKAPVYKAPEAPWLTGIYVGANVGYSWGSSSTNVTFTTPPAVGAFGAASDFSMNGAIGGLQAGYNWQHDRWVLGLETDIQLSEQAGGATYTCPGAFCALGTTLPGGTAAFPGMLSFGQRLEWFGTLRGRIGNTFISPTWLTYVTGGLAYGSIDSSGTLSGFSGVGAPVVTRFASETTKVGWTLGVGLEGRIVGNWTGKIEYLYIDFGTISFNAANTLAANPSPIFASVNSHITDSILRIGVNYQFH
jgi:outer membrane immunogenic protein